MASKQGEARSRLLTQRLKLNMKTALEESKVSSSLLRLPSFTDVLLKFKANDESYMYDNTVTEDSEVDGPEGPPPSASSVSEEEVFLKTESQLEDACQVALSSLVQLRENASDVNRHNIESYTEQVFGLSKARYEELYEKASKAERPELKLKCKVLSAEGLEAKDANGKSDPYCRLTILNRKHQDSRPVRHDKQYNMVQWKRDELVREVKTTSAKQATLEPVWNEEFELTLTDPKVELLVVEVWDSDEESVGVAKIKGFKGLGNFFHDMKKGDDFLGRAFYLLQTVPVEGEDRVFHLYSHSGKHTKGTVKVHLCIGGLRDDVPVEVSLKEYSTLLQAVVQHDSKKKEQYVRRWDAKLTSEGEKLLLQYASLNGIIELQEAAVRLSVLLEYHKNYAVEMEAFSELILQIKGNRMAQLGVTGKEPPQWIVQLFENLQELASYILDVMKDHLMVFNLKSPQGVERIKKHIITLRDLYSFRPFVQRLHQDQKNFQDTLETCIQASVPRWFLVLSGKSMPLVNTGEEQLVAFRGLVQHCLHQCQRTLKSLAPMFTEFGVDYFTHFFQSLDKLLHSEAVSRLEAYGNEDTICFEIYLIFKQIKALTPHVDEKVRCSLNILKMDRWFKALVNAWIRTATVKCKEKIRKAIEIDEVIEVTDEAKFSSSAVDTKSFLLQVGAFWKHLAWPLPAEAYGFAVTVIKNICECALYYVEAVYGSLKKSDIHDDNGRFRATERLCVILNDMAHVRMALAALRQKLELQDFYEWLDEADQKERQKENEAKGKSEAGEQQAPAQLGKQAEKLIDSLLTTTDDDIANKISQIVTQISKKLSPDIRQFIQNMIIAKSEVPVEEALTPLLDYLTQNLQILGDYLLYPVFRGILHPLWAVTLSTLQKSISTVPKKSNTLYIHERMYAGSMLLKEFFNADGNGLSNEDLETEQYQDLLTCLETIRLPTDKLVLRFQSDLLKQQEREGERKLGTLLLSVGYLRDRSVVEVTIIQGQNLPGLDKSGLSDPFIEMYLLLERLSDPFIELYLLPESMFTKSAEKQFKTTTQKQTLDPVYNEEFHMPCMEQDLDQDGAILLLAIYDYDLIGANDFAGLCVVSCKDMPRLAGARASLVDPDGPERKNLVLPLFHIKETIALRELEARYKASDSEAIKFYKTFNKYLDKAIRFSHRLSILH